MEIWKPHNLRMDQWKVFHIFKYWIWTTWKHVGIAFFMNPTEIFLLLIKCKKMSLWNLWKVPKMTRWSAFLEQTSKYYKFHCNNLHSFYHIKYWPHTHYGKIRAHWQLSNCSYLDQRVHYMNWILIDAVLHVSSWI